jgi:hypothetical protein
MMLLPEITKEPMSQAPSFNKEVPAALHPTAVQLVCLVRCYWRWRRKRLSLIQMVLLGHLKAGFKKRGSSTR